MAVTRTYISIFILLAILISTSTAQVSSSCRVRGKSVNGCTQTCRQCCNNGVCEPETCTGCTPGTTPKPTNSSGSTSRSCSASSRSVNGCTETCTQCCTNGVYEPKTCTRTGCSSPLPCTTRCKYVRADECYKKCDTCTEECGPCFDSFRECFFS